MNFTFGIITGGDNESIISKIIDSIEKENIPNYEILIIGPCNLSRKNTLIIPFDENARKGWITKKKNIITQIANFENIVYLHDYIEFLPGWYEGHLKSGNDFKIRMDKMINYDGTRYRDWCIWPHNNSKMDEIVGKDCLIPYDIKHLSRYQYISGAYWVAKKSVMLEFPLNENLTWGEGEDVIWSSQVREKYIFDMNVNSAVKIIKANKDVVFSEPGENKIKILKDEKLWI